MTGRRLFIGNLPFTTTEAELRDAFGPCGRITQIRMPHDPNTQKFRGFAFVEFSNAQEAATAIERWDQAAIGGLTIIVSEAKPEEPRGSSYHGQQRGHRWDRRERREARW